MASEPHLSKQEALKQGFKASIQISKLQTNFSEPLPHSLQWPIQFLDSKRTIGNSMPEYQNYGTEAYYHGGSDLRLKKEGAVTSPVNGFLQGDFYTFVTDPETGHDVKYTKPFSDGGDDLYFEITVKSADGFQFEFHHVNPNNLPANIQALVEKGGGEIHQGDLVGYASIWPVVRLGSYYDHIHYNIIAPNGASANAEYFSVNLPDASAPVIKNIYAIYKDKKIEVVNNKLLAMPTELLVSAYDMKGDNIYPLPPVYVEAEFNKKEKTIWDFTKYLLNSLGQFPDIREVYARNVKLTDGRVITTQGDYEKTNFVFRLKIPAEATLPIQIKIKDASENMTQLTLDL